MASILNKGNISPTEITREMFNAVRGNSALAKLSPSRPVPFNGATEMVFSFDHEASIVGYGGRVSDEFMYGTEEKQIEILKEFVEAASRRFARALDIAALHGLNPYNLTASTVVGTNNFESQVTNTVAYVGANADTNVSDAVALVEATGALCDGIAMSTTMKSAIGALSANGAPKYPAFSWGGAPEQLGNMTLAVNPTVNMHASGAATTLHGLVGDFSAFKWGYAKEVPLQVIPYGNPDNSADGDLAGHNQVYLRAEVYIGWAILAPTFFAKIEA